MYRCMVSCRAASVDAIVAKMKAMRERQKTIDDCKKRNKEKKKKRDDLDRERSNTFYV